MYCPVCKSEPMVVLELEQIEIDYCLKCGGIWLDGGELELLLESSRQKTAILNSFQADNQAEEVLSACPICLKKMEKVSCGQDKKIIIDKCKDNHGLWFDKGELYEIVKMGSLEGNNNIVNMLENMFRHDLNKVVNKEV